MLASLCALAVTVQSAAPITIDSGLVIGGVGRGGRVPLPTDALQHAIVLGTWKAPTEGGTLENPDGQRRTWRSVKAGSDGWIADQALGGGYLYASVDAPKKEVRILEAAGHGSVYVNGELRTGDVYGYGYLKAPVLLKQGQNDFLFNVGRGRLKASLVEAKAPYLLSMGDVTAPDLLPSDKSAFAATVVMNATEQQVSGLEIETSGPGLVATRTRVPSLKPLAIRKVRFDLTPAAPLEPGNLKVSLSLLRNGRRVDTADLTLRVRKPSETHKRTFISGIDGSVQYFAVNPAQKPSNENALILTLHGASVEGLGQAEAYRSKDWANIVAATNRRPYGFDWEDWGRLDALEVLEHAKKSLEHDPRRIHLTGHSMGGHGTWHIGSMFPDKFASIGPSAGWVSFWSYAGGYSPQNPGPAEELLFRAMSPSDTLGRLRNMLGGGVYVLHGDKDDNVPVGQARTMREALKPLHTDFNYHEQPGAGHWWGGECVDWPAMFAMFERRKLELIPDKFEFTTQNPAISGSYAWATIEQQEKSMKASTIKVGLKLGVPQIETENVAMLSLGRWESRDGAVIDGQQVDVPFWDDFLTQPRRIHFRKVDGRWSWIRAVEPMQKTAARGGPFKQAFANRMIFVYGTKGSKEENAWSLAKARYDAEAFYYRGNGSIDIVADRDLDFAQTQSRNIILYGNRDNNSAWSKLLAHAPIQVSRDEVNLAGRPIKGADLAVLFLYPKREGKALVGAVSGTGLAGLRLTERLPYFVSGVAYPDWSVLSSDVLLKGAKGIKATGYFGNDWGLDSGEFRFQ